jgi:hypothetical protein
MPQDFTTDPNPRYLYVAELHHPFPEWVANAPVPSADQFTKKSNAAFADPSRRLLPIADKVSTFHSVINLLADVTSFPDSTFDRVKEACDFFGISADVAPYAELFADRLEKSAANDAPPVEFAIDEEINGENYKLLPLTDTMDVEDAGFSLAKMASDNRIHFLHFVNSARRVVKAAAAHSILNTLPELILRVGSERAHNLEKAARLLEGRSEYARIGDSEAIKAAYEEALQEEDPNVVMNKIAAIDTAAGISHRYHAGAALPLPSDIVFNGPLISEIEKVAREHAAVGNVLVPLQELKNVDRRALAFSLSKEAGEAIIRVLDDTDDASDVSLLVDSWADEDRRTLLRLAASA